MNDRTLILRWRSPFAALLLALLVTSMGCSSGKKEEAAETGVPAAEREAAEGQSDGGDEAAGPSDRVTLSEAAFATARIEVEPGLLEIDYGEWDGLTAEECMARDPELRARWEADPYETRCPSGESGRDLAERSFAVLSPIEAWLAEDRARCAVVIAHNHVNRVRLCALFGWPMREYRSRLAQDPAGYNLIGFGGATPVVRRVNAAPG